jgi:CBS domain-containing protein
MLNPIRELLLYKGRQVHAVSGRTCVSVAVQRMNEAHIGALIVLEQGCMCGIFTERDVLLRVVDAGADPASTPVEAVMTPDPRTITTDTSVQEAMKLITDTRCRHLPVLENDRLVGMISSGDLMRWMVYDQGHQIEKLMHYITDTGAVDRSHVG